MGNTHGGHDNPGDGDATWRKRKQHADSGDENVEPDRLDDSSAPVKRCRSGSFNNNSDATGGSSSSSAAGGGFGGFGFFAKSSSEPAQGLPEPGAPEERRRKRGRGGGSAEEEEESALGGPLSAKAAGGQAVSWGGWPASLGMSPKRRMSAASGAYDEAVAAGAAGGARGGVCASAGGMDVTASTGKIWYQQQAEQHKPKQQQSSMMGAIGGRFGFGSTNRNAWNYGVTSSEASAIRSCAAANSDSMQ